MIYSLQKGKKQGLYGIICIYISFQGLSLKAFPTKYEESSHQWVFKGFWNNSWSSFARDRPGNWATLTLESSGPGFGDLQTQELGDRPPTRAEYDLVGGIPTIGS